MESGIGLKAADGGQAVYSLLISIYKEEYMQHVVVEFSGTGKKTVLF